MHSEFHSKASVGNKSIAGLLMEERAHQQGQHCTSPTLNPTLEGKESSCTLGSLGWLLKWGLRAGQSRVQEEVRAVLTRVRRRGFLVEVRSERKVPV